MLEMKAMLERTLSEIAVDSPPTGRRILFFSLVGLSIAGLIWLLIFALSANGSSPGDLILAALFMVTLPWTVIGFWNATIGLLIMRFAVIRLPRPPGAGRVRARADPVVDCDPGLHPQRTAGARHSPHRTDDRRAGEERRRTAISSVCAERHQ
jgi:hypothetical protein